MLCRGRYIGTLVSGGSAGTADHCRADAGQDRGFGGMRSPDSPCPLGWHGAVPYRFLGRDDRRCPCCIREDRIDGLNIGDSFAVLQSMPLGKKPRWMLASVSHGLRKANSISKRQMHKQLFANCMAKHDCTAGYPGMGCPTRSGACRLNYTSMLRCKWFVDRITERTWRF